MRTWLAAVCDSLRGGFWFIPTALTVLLFLVALVMPLVDEAARLEQRPYFSWMATTASASEATLANLLGALVTVTAVVSSVTMVTLSLTASQFGSRLLRTFRNRNITQWASPDHQVRHLTGRARANRSVQEEKRA